jgi:hypothetical protein
MSEAYDSTLERLRTEIDAGGARPSVIDEAVSTLFANGNRSTAADLLSLLSDNAEYDEGMFSLIHAAESFDKSTYVQALLSVFPRLVMSSPRWASIVLIRVLNNSQAQLKLVRQLRNAPLPVKESVRDMCERINGVSPQFLSKTTPVSLAAA